jgi:hypothetical protein
MIDRTTLATIQLIEVTINRATEGGQRRKGRQAGRQAGKSMEREIRSQRRGEEGNGSNLKQTK